MENLPVTGRRWDNFVLLSPGVTNDGNFGLVSYRGISGLYNNNMVDGVDNNQAFFSEARGRTRIAYSISESSIKEFQVGVSNMSAEFGRVGRRHGERRDEVRAQHASAARGSTSCAIRRSRPAIRRSSCRIRRRSRDERRQQFGAAHRRPDPARTRSSSSATTISRSGTSRSSRRRRTRRSFRIRTTRQRAPARRRRPTARRRSRSSSR